MVAQDKRFRQVKQASSISACRYRSVVAYPEDLENNLVNDQQDCCQYFTEIGVFGMDCAPGACAHDYAESPKSWASQPDFYRDIGRQRSNVVFQQLDDVTMSGTVQYSTIEALSRSSFPVYAHAISILTLSITCAVVTPTPPQTNATPGPWHPLQSRRRNHSTGAEKVCNGG